MMVIRVEKTENYTVMSNRHLQDKLLSLKAKGLMSLMLSLPDDWEYTAAGLATLSRDGLDGVKTALKELEGRRYLTMSQTRDARGRMSAAEYVLRENPSSENPSSENPLSENPLSENPLSENPLSENPLSENPTQQNTNTTKYLSDKSTDRQRDAPPKRQAFVKPTKGEIEAYCREKGYDLDADCFLAHYESNGWRVGRNAMKDWRAAVRTWVYRTSPEGGGKGTLEKAYGLGKRVECNF